MLETFPKDVRLVLKQFPLDMHPFARKAAAAAIAAGRQGKYPEMSHSLFENHEVLNDNVIREIARKLGLDVNQLGRDMNDSSVQALINADMNDGLRARVQGTPTVFINGKLVRKLGPEIIQDIETEIRKKRK